MGVQKKHGKGRLDKWYRLAKEKGYRARAAFKLIQLNRRYKFLENSKVLIDLCAAPGSWCQVAAEIMPAKSLIIGVDLVPIKPIPRTITVQSDITTDACRAALRAHLKNWKAETVLHDGAPNVGTAWVQDAFSQAELVLQALKLAIQFLSEGGTFVTKVFRSKDYNPLLWVFNQLFAKVEATKPPSSRNVSAEIFVVCRGFKAPRIIDAKLLDPRSVFAELADSAPDNEAKVFKPELKKRKRGGYDEGEYIQFKEDTASHFIQAADPIVLLATLNRLTFQQNLDRDILLEAVNQSPYTTVEIRQCCDDLKVLGRKEFRMLLRWRLQLRERFEFASDSYPATANEENRLTKIAPMEDELRLEQELQSLSNVYDARKKRERRKGNTSKQREIVRMQMHMLAPTDLGLEQGGPVGEDQLYSTAKLRNLLPHEFSHRSGLSKTAATIAAEAARSVGLTNGCETGHENVEHEDSDDDDCDDGGGDRLNGELDIMYTQYQARRASTDMKNWAKKARQEHHDEWEGLSQPGSIQSGLSDSDFDPSDASTSRGALSDGSSRGGRIAETLTKRASVFFNRDILKDIVGKIPEMNKGEESSSTSNSDAGFQGSQSYRTHRTKPLNKGVCEARLTEIDGAVYKSTKGSQRTGSDAVKYIPVVAQDPQEIEQKIATYIEPGPHGTGSRQNVDIITGEAMTLAHELVSGQRRASNVVDEGFNKYAFKDRDGLPAWFLDDEGKHSKAHRPITAAAATAIKEKLRALNARPIKKVREAKDRKKYKLAQKLEKLRKKSAMLADEEGLTEQDKAKTIARIMSKAVKKNSTHQVKVVVARGSNRGISGRPRGIKGRYKIVDARMKKDVRAEKRSLRKQS